MKRKLWNLDIWFFEICEHKINTDIWTDIQTCWSTTLNHSQGNVISINWYKKGKGFPYSLPNVGPGADPGVQAVSPQVTISHPPGSRLPLLSTRPLVTFPAAQHYRPLAGTKLYCLVTTAHRWEQLAQGCYAALPRVGIELKTCWSQVQCATYWYRSIKKERK